MTNNRGKRWTEDETTLAYALYCEMPFGKIGATNPKVIELAKLLGRTPGSVGMKMCNLARFDPELKKRNINGLANGSKMDEYIYRKYESNLEELAYKVQQIKQGLLVVEPEYQSDDMDKMPEGKDKVREVKTRVGQNAFRRVVLNSYHNKCCITGIDNSELLVASHIKPWKVSDSATERTNPRNGLCLNSLHDKAFDSGLITIDKGLHVIISENLAKTEMDDNTREWLKCYDHKQISLPEKFVPSIEFIEYHNDVIFQG